MFYSTDERRLLLKRWLQALVLVIVVIAALYGAALALAWYGGRPIVNNPPTTQKETHP